LFMTALWVIADGPTWLPSVKLLANPHAAKPLAKWVADVVDETRAESQRLIGRPD
jgi:hypothetical protein